MLLHIFSGPRKQEVNREARNLFLRMCQVSNSNCTEQMPSLDSESSAYESFLPLSLYLTTMFNCKKQRDLTWGDWLK